MTNSSSTKEFLRFFLVGLINTLVHFCVLYFAYELLSIELVTSTLIAFAIAVVVTYLLNYRFTFRSKKKHKSSLPKFIVTVLIGLGWKVGITVLVVQYLEGPLLLAVIAAAFVIMINNYLLSKFWVF